MTYEETMAEIEAGLTGDPKHDIKYLKEQCDKYKDSENGREIVRACGRLMAKALPEDAMAEINKALNKDFSKFEKKLNEVKKCQIEKNFGKALELLEPLIKDMEGMESNGLYADDSVSEYYCFDDPMEEVLYAHFNNCQKELRHCDIPYATAYMQYGSLLIDLDRWDDAQKALKKALEWNPSSTHIIFELGETYKHANELDLYFKTIIDAFKYCYEPHSLARAYRNIGYYFIEKELYDEAIAAYFMSYHFEQSELVQNELMYINKISGKEIVQPSIDDMKKVADKYGFTIGAHEDVLGIAFAIGKDAMGNGKSGNETAKYFFSIVYNLTGDDDIKQLIDKL